MESNMTYYALVLDSSRKAKAVRNLYEVLRGRTRDSSALRNPIQFGDVAGVDGIRVSASDRYRVLNLRIHDEHLSPYFRTDMNLFQMLMIDEETEMSLYRSERGWIIEFEGLAPGPVPFGQNGFDLR